MFTSSPVRVDYVRRARPTSTWEELRCDGQRERESWVRATNNVNMGKKVRCDGQKERESWVRLAVKSVARHPQKMDEAEKGRTPTLVRHTAPPTRVHPSVCSVYMFNRSATCRAVLVSSCINVAASFFSLEYYTAFGTKTIVS